MGTFGPIRHFVGSTVGELCQANIMYWCEVEIAAARLMEVTETWTSVLKLGVLCKCWVAPIKPRCCVRLFKSSSEFCKATLAVAIILTVVLSLGAHDRPAKEGSAGNGGHCSV